MRFLRKNKVKKTVIVISDIHLGAGAYYKNERNFLEDFHYDQELVDFLEYYSTGQNAAKEIELIINGDFLDLLAVPFVEYFDDEFWSEEAALEKLNIILDAHPEVLEALNNFVKNKNKTITFIIGNHDAELIFPSLQARFTEIFDKEHQERFRFYTENSGVYEPIKGVVIQHGHEYEVAHQFEYDTCVQEDENGRKYFIPPWGSYYVIRVINKFKEIRPHVNAIRPIKKFLINGLIYDTLFTIRFMLANGIYFILVRVISMFKESSSTGKILKEAMHELELFKDYEDLVQEKFEKDKDLNVLIVGHTHEPIYRAYQNGKVFINTGTWTHMHHLDFERSSNGPLLTYALIELKDGEEEENLVESALNVWQGTNNHPFHEFLL
jgi:UDP-2,3-diacylglucosamine pyrophosphatase LpxH